MAFEGVNGWRGIGEELISRGIRFQMAGAEQRKERELKLMLDGVGKDSAGQRSGENELVGGSG